MHPVQACQSALHTLKRKTNNHHVYKSIVKSNKKLYKKVLKITGKQDSQQSQQLQLEKNRSSEKLDIIIFGASGHLGSSVVEYAAGILNKNRWGIAGRDKQKLEDILKTTANKLSVNLSEVPIFVANVRNTDSLEKMTGACKVLINCVGPYQEFGESVITSCLTTNTHYIDAANAEPFYLGLIQLKYNGMAKTQRIYIIPACGWASFPIDIGINIIKKHFDGTINSIETYTEYSSPGSGVPLNSIASLTSWKSIVLGCKDLRHLPLIRKKLQSNPVPQMMPNVRYNGIFHNSKIVDRICLTHAMDQLLVERSQYYFYHQENRRPIQFRNYLAFSSKALALLTFIWIIFIALMAQLEYTRNLLLKYAGLFSLGAFTERGPERAFVQKMFFCTTFRAVGWSSCLKTAPDELFRGQPNREVICKVCGTNPWYGITSICLLAAAMTLINNSKNMPSVGGVFTPGPAFANTNIAELLAEHSDGLKYHVVI